MKHCINSDSFFSTSQTTCQLPTVEVIRLLTPPPPQYSCPLRNCIRLCIMTSPDVFTSLCTVARHCILNPNSPQVSPWVSPCTLHCSQLVHFLNLLIQNNLLLWQMLTHSQGLTSVATIQADKCCYLYLYL